MGQLLTTSEVAAILRCSDDTVLALIRAGKLSAIDIAAGTKNKRYRVSSDALSEFQQSASTKPKPIKIARPEPVTTGRFAQWKKAKRVS